MILLKKCQNTLQNNVLTLYEDEGLSKIGIEAIDQLIIQIAHEYHTEVITRKYEWTPQ